MGTWVRIGLLGVVLVVVPACASGLPPEARPPSATTEVTDEQAAVLRACESVVADEFTDYRLVQELPAKDGARQYHVLAKGLVGDEVRDVEFVVTAPSATPVSAGLTKPDCTGAAF